MFTVQCSIHILMIPQVYRVPAQWPRVLAVLGRWRRPGQQARRQLRSLSCRRPRWRLQPLKAPEAGAAPSDSGAGPSRPQAFPGSAAAAARPEWPYGRLSACCCCVGCSVLLGAVCCCVLLCAAVCCCVLLCAAVCCCVLLCAAVCCCVLLCAAVCCCVLLCAGLCAAVCWAAGCCLLCRWSASLVFSFAVVLNIDINNLCYTPSMLRSMLRSMLVVAADYAQKAEFER